MSDAMAKRLDMLKNPITSARSKISSWLSPAARSASRSASTISAGVFRQLPREIQHRALPLRQLRHPVVHHQHLAQLRIAREFAHRLTMGHEAVETPVCRGHDHGHHLALQLREARGGQHQRVVILRKRLELLHVARKRPEHVGHQPQFLDADLEIAPGLIIERGDLGQDRRSRYGPVVACRPPACRRSVARALAECNPIRPLYCAA
jgi:hypothetical protein